MADRSHWRRPQLRSRAFTVGGLVALAALIASGGCRRPRAEDVARKVEKAYAQASELEQTSAIITSVKLLEKRDVRTERVRLYFKRPTMLRLETGSSDLEPKAVCDGKNLYTRSMNHNSWLKEPAPRKWSESELLRLYTPASQQLLLAMLDGGTPLSSANDVSVADRSERVGGTTCYVLSASSEKAHAGGAFSFKEEQRLWVGTRDFLIRRCAVKMVAVKGGAGGPFGRLMEKLQTSEVEVAKPSLRLRARRDVFSFKSPPGTEVVTYRPGNALAALRATADPLARAKGLIGLKAPELSLGDWIKGPKTHLAALRGKVVLLDFWATWCVPCVQTAPILEQMYEDYSRRGLVVIGIHETSAGAAGIGGFMRAHGMTYRVAIDKEDAQQRPLTYARYKGGALPMAVLIDRAGVIRWVGHPGQKAALKSEVEALLQH